MKDKRLPVTQPSLHPLTITLHTYLTLDKKKHTEKKTIVFKERFKNKKNYTILWFGGPPFCQVRSRLSSQIILESRPIPGLEHFSQSSSHNLNLEQPGSTAIRTKIEPYKICCCPYFNLDGQASPIGQ